MSLNNSAINTNMKQNLLVIVKYDFVRYCSFILQTIPELTQQSHDDKAEGSIILRVLFEISVTAK
jgi:hypothetical protein